jgi:hypothetical protein
LMTRFFLMIAARFLVPVIVMRYFVPCQLPLTGIR